MEKVIYCEQCEINILGAPFAPSWMLGKKFCSKACAEENYEANRKNVLAGLRSIGEKYRTNPKL